MEEIDFDTESATDDEDNDKGVNNDLYFNEDTEFEENLLYLKVVLLCSMRAINCFLACHRVKTLKQNNLC